MLRQTACAARGTAVGGDGPQAQRLGGLANLLLEPRHVQPDESAKIGDRAVIDEPVGRDAEDPDRRVAQRRIGQARVLDRLEDGAAEPAGGDALLERHHEPLAARLVEDQLPIERLGEARIDDADRPAIGGQAIRDVDGALDDRAEADEQEVSPLAQDLALADRDGLRLDRREPEPGIARVVQRERVVLGERRPQQRA